MTAKVYNKLELEFMDRALVRGGLMLFTPEVACELVRKCIDEECVIYGIDGFHVFDEKIQPVQDHSVDFSASDNSRLHLSSEETCSAAINFFLDKKDTDLFFEITFSP